MAQSLGAAETSLYRPQSRKFGMQRQLDVGLNELKAHLVGMAGCVERAIECANEAWRKRSLAKIQEVYAIETQVNATHMVVDDICFKLIALQQPMASDLRLILSCTKINSDLERMVDLAVNIANNTEYLLKDPAPIIVPDLVPMADEVRVMVREVLAAFVSNDEALAKLVLKRDDRIDNFKRKILNDILTEMKTDSLKVDSGLNIILVAKNLERIGDHATNIAEDVIFTISGQDVRHPGTRNMK